MNTYLKTLLRSIKGLYVVAIAFTCLVAMIMMAGGCAGPAGPDGDDAVLADSILPTISWIQPEAGAAFDSLAILSVRANDDQGVWRMIFYVGGFSFTGMLVDSVEGIYQFNWSVIYYPQGPYPLMARVWDAARNQATTPVRLVYVEHDSQ